MFSLIKKHWPLITTGLILGIIIVLNFHPGKLVMGNDNFSPELNPSLTISRSFLNPAWRDNRMLGIPSDSEQADVWRTLFFWLGSQVLPTWMISQGYLFLTLIVGVLSMGKSVRLLTNNSRISEFFGSLLYLFSPITVWIYFYPVHLFVAAYAFTPLVLWMALRTVNRPTRSNKIILLLSSLMMGTTALTATMFITTSLTILALTFIYSITKSQIKNWIISMFIFILPQLFWILPFASYVKSNSDALQNSSINREITTSTIASEQSNNTWDNTLRFSTAWMDSREDDNNYTYQAREWFRTDSLGIKIGYSLSLLAFIGLIISLFNPHHYFLQILTGIIGFFGFIFINGFNPPFSSIYAIFDQYIPLFHQVFRWSSSKFWPILLYPLIILASLAISKIINFTRFHILQIPLLLGITALVIYSAHPIVSYRLIREEVFITIPDAYSDFQNYSSQRVGAIDTTPHTNTRYFRKYDWGFWGSVFLNYLLPNPTTEKALVIGSDENQLAFDNIDQAYHSQDPQSYIASLARYNITQVLSDKSVTNEHLGASYAYPFDWDLHTQIVSENTGLESTWKKDFLSLFKVNTSLSNQSIPISALHNISILNKSLSTTYDINPYYMNDTGLIFPLALKPALIYQSNSALNIETKFNTSALYQIDIPSSNLNNIPSIAHRTDTTLTISPYFPIIKRNNSPVYELPTKTIKITENPITINDQLVGTSSIILEPNKALEIKSWENKKDTLLSTAMPTLCSPEKSNPENQNCYRSDLDISNDSVISVATDINATNPTLVDICLHSRINNSCINSPKTFLADNHTQTITIGGNIVVNKNDNIVVFFVAKTTDNTSPSLSALNLSLSQFTQPQTIAYDQYDLPEIKTTLKLMPGDTLTTQLPVTNLIPPFQIFRATCESRGEKNEIVIKNGSTNLTTQNCFDGLYTNFSLPTYLDSIGMLSYLKADYHQGIPLEYNLKQDKIVRKVSTDLLPTEIGKSLLNFTLLPKNNQNFTIELANRGIGNIASINNLQDFAAIPIPRHWLLLKLIPSTLDSRSITSLSPFITKFNTGTYLAKVGDSKSLYTLPTATSPNWRATILSAKPRNLLDFYLKAIFSAKLTDKYLVNGWQDSWSVNAQDQGKYIAVIFFPNVLAYLGLIIGLGTAFVLIVVRQATKTASTHTVE